MNNLRKYLSVLFLTVFFLSTIGLSASAQEETSAAELHITSMEEFEAFRENCRTDSYSRNLSVYLETDLDFTGRDFTGIPTFSGTFYGNNHSIKGLSLTENGSVQGLFRYLTDTAHVQDLSVQGEICPQGSGSTVGGIAGSNAGTIQNCTFSGTVSGTDRVGGLAGTNELTGLIENGSTQGTVSGSHFVGGLAGHNYGVIRQCSNGAAVNITSHENNVDLSHISVNTITGTEAANTVTDIGGIAGSNSGVIRSCVNEADVGYQHMGYNVGGIAGSQKGYIEACTNKGSIHGRKDVGGIVGQVEPISQVDFTKDTLQILQGQLADTSALVNKASANAHSSASRMDTQIGLLGQHAQTASDAITQLVPSKDSPELPDSDALLAAKNTLGSSMHAMEGTMQSISSSAKTGVQQLNSDIEAISNQMNAISQTLNEASSHMGGTFTDISDGDTPEDQTGKLLGCTNAGTVDGDRNTGGIVGAIAMENDLDPEDDFQFSGSRSLNFEGQLRAVVRECQNSAPITGKKENVGGIVGRAALGLMKDCVSTGDVEATGADYVGGIAGTSSGFIRNCSAKAQLSGKTCVGGIAGSAAVVSDCRSITHIDGGIEKLGSVLGIQENSKAESPLSGNYYLTTREEYGAVDGINYSGAAESLPLEEFLALPDLPESFTTSTITFCFEDGTRESITVPLGGSLDTSAVPAVPQKEEHTGLWGNLDPEELSQIYFDKTAQLDYTPYQVTVQSQLTRENGKPLLLAQGHFRDMDHFALTPLNELPALSGRKTPLEGYALPVFSEEEDTTLRLAYPEEQRPDCLEVFVRDKEGAWQKTHTEVNSSYLVFSVTAQQDAFCLVQIPKPLPWLLIGGAGVVIAAAVTGIVVAAKKKKRAVKSQKNTASDPL